MDIPNRKTIPDGLGFVLKRARQGHLRLFASADRPGFAWFWPWSILPIAALLPLPEGTEGTVLALRKILAFLVG